MKMDFKLDRKGPSAEDFSNIVEQVNAQLIKQLAEMASEGEIDGPGAVVNSKVASDMFNGVLTGLTNVATNTVVSAHVSGDLPEDETIDIARTFGRALEDGVREALASPKLKALKAYRKTMIEEMTKAGDTRFMEVGTGGKVDMDIVIPDEEITIAPADETKPEEDTK